MNKISAVVLIKNNEDRILKFSRMLKCFDEVVFIDDQSSDNSIKVLQKMNLKYYSRELNGDFSAQRNYALSRTIFNWVLFLDSDESIDDSFIKEAKFRIESGGYVGFLIKRINIFLNHEVIGTEMGTQNIVRLANKTKGQFVRSVHEYWNIEGNIGIIQSSIVHNTASSINEFINKINIYYSIHAKENIESGKNAYFINLILFPILKYLRNMILLKGYKDGVYGFVISVLMSFHSFLSWSEMWLISRNKKRSTI